MRGGEQACKRARRCPIEAAEHPLGIKRERTPLGKSWGRKTRDRLLEWNNRTGELLLTTEVDNIQESIHTPCAVLHCRRLLRGGVLLTTEVDNIQESIHTHPVQCYTVGDS